jgi:hypothetical protein
MTDMKEKMARAMCAAGQRYCEQMHICDQGPPCKCGYWEIYLPAAHAALEAMREPTPEMINATFIYPDSDGAIYAIEGRRNIWQAMIDQARGQ